MALKLLRHIQSPCLRDIPISRPTTKAHLNDCRCLQLHIPTKPLRTQQTAEEEQLLGLGAKHGALSLVVATRL